jgi:hypothetical protein
MRNGAEGWRKVDTSAVPPSMCPMQTKKTASVVATEAAAQSVLRRGPTRDLSPEEERVMRMRLGATPPRSAPLQRSAEARTDLEIELLAAEIEAHLRWRAHQAEPATRAAKPQPSRTKEKIIRALRKKV